MRCRILHRWTTAVAVLLFILGAQPAAAEVRTYMQVQTGLTAQTSKVRLDGFFKEETRFREQGIVLHKTYVGMQPHVNKWLTVRVYYANKDVNYTRHLNKHLLAADFIVRHRFDDLTLTNRFGNEWHVTDKFYRYRNYTEGAYALPIPRLSVWVSEEFRFDSDQARMNVNDIRIGVGARVKRGLKMRTFFDLEEKRRGRNDWQSKPFLGLALVAAV